MNKLKLSLVFVFILVIFSVVVVSADNLSPCCGASLCIDGPFTEVIHSGTYHGSYTYDIYRCSECLAEISRSAYILDQASSTITQSEYEYSCTDELHLYRTVTKNICQSCNGVASTSYSGWSLVTGFVDGPEYSYGCSDDDHSCYSYMYSCCPGCCEYIPGTAQALVLDSSGGVLVSTTVEYDCANGQHRYRSVQHYHCSFCLDDYDVPGAWSACSIVLSSSSTRQIHDSNQHGSATHQVYKCSHCNGVVSETDVDFVACGYHVVESQDYTCASAGLGDLHQYCLVHDYVCDYCNEVINRSYGEWYDLPHTLISDPVSSASEIANITYRCDHCHNIVSYSIAFESCNYIVIGTQNYGERNDGYSKVYKGLSDDYVSIYGSYNIDSFLYNAGYQQHLLLTPLGADFMIKLVVVPYTGDRYDVGSFVRVCYDSDNKTPIDISALGRCLSCRACEFYVNQGLYVNGSLISYDSSLFSHSYTKKQCQFFTSCSLNDYTFAHYRDELDMSIIYFWDTDNNGAYDYVFIDPAFGFTFCELTGDRILFDDSVADTVAVSDMYSRWFELDSLLYSTSTGSFTGNENCFQCRVISSSNLSCVSNALIYLYTYTPSTTLRVSRKPGFSWQQHNSNYTLTDNDILVEQYYGDGWRILPFNLLTITNVQGVVTISFGGYSVVLSSINWHSYVSDSSGSGTVSGSSLSVDDLNVVIGNNPILGLVEGTWFVLKDGALTVLNGISVGGITLMSVFISLLVIVLVALVIKFFLKG